MLNEQDIYPYSATDISNKDALILAPHPDDESLGCGGSIIKHVNAASRIKVIFLTSGDKGDFENRFGENYINIRKQCAFNAMEALGVKDFEFWEYGDRQIGLLKDEIESRLVKTLHDFNPSLLYAPSPLEAHPDHRASFEIAWRAAKISKVTLVLYEVLMAVYPNILVDITNEIEQKKLAIEKYFTELQYNDYLSKIIGLNRFRTATLPQNIKYAEGFISVNEGGEQMPLSNLIKIIRKYKV